MLMRCKRECEKVGEFPLFSGRWGGFAETPYVKNVCFCDKNRRKWINKLLKTRGLKASNNAEGANEKKVMSCVCFGRFVYFCCRKYLR